MIKVIMQLDSGDWHIVSEEDTVLEAQVVIAALRQVNPKVVLSLEGLDAAS